MTTYGDPATGLGTPDVVSDPTDVVSDPTDVVGTTVTKGGHLTLAGADRTPGAGDVPPPATPPATGAPGAATAGPTAGTEAGPGARRGRGPGAVAPGGEPDPPAADADLTPALGNLREAIADTAYPLVLPSADDARRVAGAVVAQLDDYLLPRLARLDAPLLVVVGGSTGAGKSTLVNSLVKARVSAAGVLRPTTRSPVLVCNPADLAWYRQGELLPGLTRTANPSDRPDMLQLIAAPALPAGLALLDAPDIDSVVDANRALAGQLLAAADLWLFVTTAARYADAVPWELLRTARLRGAGVALVLDRVPPEAGDEVTAHLSEMLVAHDLGAAPLFVLPETATDGQGLLPEQVTADLRTWFGRLAADAELRAGVVRQTLDGALAALAPATEGLAGAADDQTNATQLLQKRVHAAYRGGRRSVERSVQDGRLLRGEVLARWQEFVGTGEFFRRMEARIGRLRDRLVAARAGRPEPSEQLQDAIESQLVTLLRAAAAEAAESAYAGWQSHPAGAALLEPALARPSADLPDRAERLVRDWQRRVFELVGTEGGDKRFVARGAAYAVNATGLAVMVAVFASTAFIPTGLEVAAAGGTTVAAQKVLEAIFGDQAIRTMAVRAREDLLDLLDELLGEEAGRYLARLDAAGVETDPATRLRDAAHRVEQARVRAALTQATGSGLPRTAS